MRDSMTVTDKKAYWVTPSGIIKKVPNAQIKKKEFQGRKNSHRARSTSRRSSPSPTVGPNIAVPNKEEVIRLYSSLASCSSKPAILALV